MKSLIIFITFISLSLSKLLKSPITNAILFLSADQRIIDVSINNNVISLSKLQDITNTFIVKTLPINVFPGDIIKITAKKIVVRNITDDNNNTSGGIIASIRMLNDNNDTYYTNLNEWKCNGESPIEVKTNITFDNQSVFNESKWIWNQRNTSEATCSLIIPCEKKISLIKKLETKTKEIVNTGIKKVANSKIVQGTSKMINKVANSKVVQGTSNFIKKGINAIGGIIKGKKKEPINNANHKDTNWVYDNQTKFHFRYRNNVIECLSIDKKNCLKHSNKMKTIYYRSLRNNYIQCINERLKEDWCIKAKKFLDSKQ